MDRYTKSICDGMTNYLRILGTPKNMKYEKDLVEWIAPMPETPGPALVFEIRLNEQNVEQYLEQAVAEISAGRMPAKWMIMPTYTPRDLTDRMAARGFADTNSREEGKGEPGMALDLAEYIPVTGSTALNIVQVRDYDNFSLWVKTVN